MIGARLKFLRVQRGLTKKQVAEALDIKEKSYIAYEYNSRDVSTAQLEMFANFYDVTTDYLLGREIEPEPGSQAVYGATQEETDAVIEEIANPPPDEQAVMLDLLHRLSDAARARRKAMKEFQQNGHAHEATIRELLGAADENEAKNGA